MVVLRNLGILVLGIMVAGTPLAMMSCGGGSSGGGTTFSVGGTTYGLTGTLVLQNNTTDDLTVTMDGTFTFATALDDGSSYNVTVLSDPPDQTCVVSSGTGTILSDDVIDVEVTCTDDAAPSQWTDPADGSDYISPGSKPQAALSDGGDAIITWSNSDGVQQRVFRIEYRTGTWSSPLKIAVSDSTSVMETPRVAMDDAGNAVIAWAQRITNSSPYTSQVFASTYYASIGTWEHPSDLADNLSPDDSTTSNVQVAMANTLWAAVVWQQRKPTVPSTINNHIYAVLRNGSGWGSPPTINDNISPEDASLIDNAGNPRVGMDSNLYVTAAWWQEYGSPIQIMNGVRDPGTGVWDTRTLVNPLNRPETNVADQLDVAVGGGGSGVIVWDQPDANGDNQIYRSDNRPSGYLRPDDLAHHLSVEGTDAGNPVAAVSDSGYTVVAWEQEDGSTDCSGGTCSQIFISTRDPGSVVSYSVPATLTDNISPDGSDAYDARVAVADNGDFVVVWLQSDGAYKQVFRAESRSGVLTVPTGLTDHISTDTSSDAANAHVAMDSSGKTVIVWEQSGYIFMSEYR